MSQLCNLLSRDILRDCANRPAPGVEQKLVIMPAQNRTAITITDGVITALTYSSAGYVIDGINDIINYQDSFIRPADGQPGVLHSIQGIIIQDPSAEVRHAVNDILMGGGKYHAFLERRWKGTDDEDALLCFGTQYGLEVPDGGFIDNSNENDGCMVLTLSTPNTGVQMKEPEVPNVTLLTNYATTKAAFDNAFG